TPMSAAVSTPSTCARPRERERRLAILQVDGLEMIRFAARHGGGRPVGYPALEAEPARPAHVFELPETAAKNQEALAREFRIRLARRGAIWCGGRHAVRTAVRGANKRSMLQWQMLATL